MTLCVFPVGKYNLDELFKIKFYNLIIEFRGISWCMHCVTARIWCIHSHSHVIKWKKNCIRQYTLSQLTTKVKNWQRKKKGKRKDLTFPNYPVHWVIVTFYSCLYGFTRNPLYEFSCFYSSNPSTSYTSLWYKGVGKNDSYIHWVNFCYPCIPITLANLFFLFSFKYMHDMNGYPSIIFPFNFRT